MFASSVPESPIRQRYDADAAAGEVIADTAQIEVVTHLDGLYRTLSVAQAQTPRRGLLQRLRRVRPEPVRGLYVWGGVGRGKTYLMDLFYESLPQREKRRSHFHRFMYDVHAELRKLGRVPEPLDQVAANFARQARVICFDEMFVSDIGDAMILAGLLRELFALGVTMVATSNVHPDDLYRNGLQRAKFLPAIELIKQHMEVVHLDTETDYRLRALEQAEIYHWPLDRSADESLHRTFRSLSPEAGSADVELQIEGRTIQTRWKGDGVVWFDFAAICQGPRSQNDYIEISRCFNTVLISNVPQLGLYRDDAARRFISLVDEFYDHNVKLVLSAEVAMEQLYSGGNLGFEFQRTLSRLQEMQSHDYLALEHLP